MTRMTRVTRVTTFADLRNLEEANPFGLASFFCFKKHRYGDGCRQHTAKEISQQAIFHAEHHGRDENI